MVRPKRRDLVLVARSRERLEELACELVAAHGVRVRVLISDLASPGAAAGIHSTLRADGVDVETPVNDAGFGLRGAFVELDARRQSDMIQVNVAALTELCRVFAQDMVRRGSGRILNVAGLAAVMPGPGMAVHLRHQGLRPLVHGGARERATRNRRDGDLLEPRADRDAVRRHGRLLRSPALPGERAHALDDDRRGRTRCARARGRSRGAGWRNRLLAASVRLVPTRTAAAIARHMLESPLSEAKKVIAA